MHGPPHEHSGTLKSLLVVRVTQVVHVEPWAKRNFAYTILGNHAFSVGHVQSAPLECEDGFLEATPFAALNALVNFGDLQLRPLPFQVSVYVLGLCALCLGILCGLRVLCRLSKVGQDLMRDPTLHYLRLGFARPQN